MRAALLGDHIGPSLTPAQHELEGAALGLDYRYSRIDTGGKKLSPADLDQFLVDAEADGLVGLNVTHPHKSAVVEFLHRLEGPAKELETANTVVLRAGERIGYNTDYGGFRRAIQRKIASIAGDSVILCGAGGAGASVALALADLGVGSLFIIDPVAKRASDLEVRLKKLRPRLQTVASENVDSVPFDRVSGAVNCTPLGMASHPGMAFDPRLLNRAAWAADIVYFPQNTAFLQLAEAHGCQVMDGTTMALWQAVEAFRLITGHEPDAERMKATLEGLLQQNNNENRETAA